MPTLSEPSLNRRYYIVPTRPNPEKGGQEPDIDGLNGWTVTYIPGGLCIVRDPDGLKDYPPITINSIVPDDLPLSIPIDITQAEADALTDHFGLPRVNLDGAASGRIRGK